MRTRPVVFSDAAAVLQLVVTRDVADLGAADCTLADLESEWASSAVDLKDDARVVQDGEAIVGYAIMRRSEALVVVHPDAVGRGIGSELLAWSETREVDLGRTRHRRSAAASDSAAGRLLSAAGYTKLRSLWRMRLVVDESVPVTAPPAQITMRELDLDGDAIAIHELAERSFATAADYNPHTFKAFREEHLAAHDVDPGLSLVAAVDGVDAPAGFLIAHRWTAEQTGYVGLLGVDPDHRGRGLGRALLTRAFAGFAAAGLGIAELGVASDNPRALALYRDVGMTARFQIDSYERGAT